LLHLLIFLYTFTSRRPDLGISHKHTQTELQGLCRLEQK
jgi:hypothetical protein